jgi:hypothetical protein
MTFSGATGADQLARLDLHGHGRPFAAAATSTTKCCSTGTCDQAPASGGLAPVIEGMEADDPMHLAGRFGSLDGSGVRGLGGLVR